MFEKNIVVRCYQVLILSLIILQSCTKEPQYIDTSKQSDNLFIVETDTLKPAYVVYRLDSFQTSGSNRSIIGINQDPYFGITTSRSFVRIKLASEGYLSVGSQTEKYDSIKLIMRLDHSFTGDTTLPWKASVHQLTQDLDPTVNEANPFFYNHNQLSYDPTALGTASAIIRPRVDDSVVIKLDDAFGSELFSLYKTKNEKVSTQALFQQYFKGIALQAEPGTNAIYGFSAADSGTMIRLYYHDDVGVHVNKTLDFKSQAGSYQFNNIMNDPSGTVTERVVKDHDTPSDSLSHMIFVSDLAGVVTKFTLPSVKTVATLPDFVRLQSMQLILSPVPTSFLKYPLIPYLGLGIGNETSTSLTPLYSADNTQVQNGSLVVDNQNGINTGYTFDLSVLGRAEILSTALNTNTAYMQPLSSTNARRFTLGRLVASDNANPVSPSKVIMQMLFFKK